jgi:large subunit ribosomal protein L15
MKLHDLQPAAGAHQAKTRVGRGIAAGKGKTAGRGTKGQKARAGGSIPPWFEGGQTPLHMRIPKLRGFRNRAKVVYEIVNVGDIAARIEAGAFTAAGTAPKKGEPMTINADILRAVGLVRDVRKPLKVLGNGELSTALFVVADAFTKSATAKIEAAGGTVNILEVPATQLPALGVDGEPKTRERRTAAGRAAAASETNARARRDADTAEAAAEAAAKATPAKAEKAEKPAKAPKAPKAAAEPVQTIDAADPADAAADDAPSAIADEPADVPDAVAEQDAADPVPGDDSDRDAPAGDESA